MAQEEDNDKYVVYTGVEDGAATFALFERDHDRDRAVRRITMPPEDIPVGTERRDHFWVSIDEDGNIEELQFDDELTDRKKENAQSAIETHKKMQEISKQRRNDDDGEYH